jgi:hypothetical protein
LYLLGNAAEETSVLGLEDNSFDKQLNVYPTMTSEILNVDLLNGQQEVDYVIYDISGRELSKGKFKESNNQYNVSRFSSGLYIISFENRGRTAIYRFIKN